MHTNIGCMNSVSFNHAFPQQSLSSFLGLAWWNAWASHEVSASSINWTAAINWTAILTYWIVSAIAILLRLLHGLCKNKWIYELIKIHKSPITQRYYKMYSWLLLFFFNRIRHCYLVMWFHQKSVRLNIFFSFFT